MMRLPLRLPEFDTSSMATPNSFSISTRASNVSVPTSLQTWTTGRLSCHCHFGERDLPCLFRHAEYSRMFIACHLMPGTALQTIQTCSSRRKLVSRYKKTHLTSASKTGCLGHLRHFALSNSTSSSHQRTASSLSDITQTRVHIVRLLQNLLP